MRYLYLRLPAPPASADGRAYFFFPNVATNAVDEVVLFVDYENIRQSLNARFGRRRDEFDPIKYSNLIIGRRRKPTQLKELRIYRGVPDRNREPERFQKDRRQIRRWLRDPKVVFIGRPMKYVENSGAGREKGIDTALAIDAIVHAFRYRADGIIICSRDSDLEPVIEFLLTGLFQPAQVEVVGVKGLSRLKFRNTERPWCHYLTREDFELIRED
jgi:uncharacterized LabA/DUF88 family protein